LDKAFDERLKKTAEELNILDERMVYLLKNGVKLPLEEDEKGTAALTKVFRYYRDLPKVASYLIETDQIWEDDGIIEGGDPISLILGFNDFKTLKILYSRVKDWSQFSSEGDSVFGGRVLGKDVLWASVSKEDRTPEDIENLDLCYNFLIKIYGDDLLNKLIYYGNYFWLNYFFERNNIEDWEIDQKVLDNHVSDYSNYDDTSNILIKNGLDPERLYIRRSNP
jgi:hypothetical protein